MQWTDLPLKPTERMLRQFAALWLGFFGVIAAWQWFVHHRPAVAAFLVCLSLTVGLFGLLRPASIKPLFIGCTLVTFPIGWIVSRLVLGFVFYGLFAPLGLLFRLMGRDPLQLRRRPNATTYWLTKPAPTDPKRYFRQY